MFGSNVLGDDSERSNDSRTPYRQLATNSRQRLVFTRGAARVTLESLRGSDETIETDFDGADVRVVRTPNEIRIGFDWSFWSYAYDALLGGPLELPHSTLRLNRSFTWDVRCRGGVSKLDAHLEDVQVSSFAIEGGASNVAISLGPPSGIVPIRIRGGVSHLELVRPAGVGVRLSVRGGIGRLAFDAMELDAVGGGLALSSQSGANADDRYEIEIGGGVSDLLIA